MSALRLTIFFTGDWESPDGVACTMTGLFWLKAVSRFKRRTPRTDITLPGGRALAETTSQYNGRPHKGEPHKDGNIGAMSGVMCLFFMAWNMELLRYFNQIRRVYV